MPDNKTMRSLFASVFTLTGFAVSSQPTNITLDGFFTDWVAGLPASSETDSYSGVNLQDFTATNNADWLYLKLHCDDAFDITDNLVSHTVILYLDTDNNSATGTAVATNFGAELTVNFRTHVLTFNPGAAVSIGFSDVSLRVLPTTTSDTFEIAIARNAIPDGVNNLFTGSTIKILFRNTSNGDYLPNNGSIFTYTLSDSPTAPYTPIALEKENQNLVRMVAYNSQGNLGVLTAQDNFDRILSAINPDIICFSEASTNTAAQVKTLLDNWVPTGGSGWYTTKDDYDLITCSRWPFTSTWNYLDRQYATLIDLPVVYIHDLLCTNAHLQCCSADATRQDQCDEFIEFTLDAKTAGGSVALPAGTPMVFCGDMNFVGWEQQLTTALTGDIQDNVAYGPDGAPDWDGSNFTDAVPLNADIDMAYTWREDGNAYPPGRLDYFIYSDAVMTLPKTFLLETEAMSSARLAQYGLQANDCSGASDHFPVVADFSLQMIDLTDTDGDGVIDTEDNCVNEINPTQADWNTNGTGDACDDTDDDGLSDEDELLLGSALQIQDTDNDGLTDGFEVYTSLTNPLDDDSNANNCEDGQELAGICAGCPADITGDGIVNTNDLLVFMGMYGMVCD